MTGICQNNTLPHADMWRRQVAALATNPRRDSGHDMFRYSHATSNGKQFPDPSCTTLNLLYGCYPSNPTTTNDNRKIIVVVVVVEELEWKNSNHWCI